VAEAAELLRVSKPTIYRLIRQQSLPVVKLMADIRLDPDDVAAWVESRKVAAP
jgi:excisionase family DNA binding protein